MHLSINLEEFTKPIFSNGNRTITFKSWFESPMFKYFFGKQSLIDSWVKSLDSIILSLEGFMKFINELPYDESVELLKSTSDTISKLTQMEERMNQISYLDSIEFKNKYKHMLKCLYKIESKLHRSVYSSKKINTTPEDLKEGAIKLNSNFYKVV